VDQAGNAVAAVSQVEDEDTGFGSDPYLDGVAEVCEPTLEQWRLSSAMEAMAIYERSLESGYDPNS
jgi:hypothetical protein